MSRGMLVLLAAVIVLASFVDAADTPRPNVLEKGDRLAMVGDSITYGKKYTVLINLYLAACRPDLDVKCIQNAVYGENTPRFVRRMKKTSIELWHPAIVTTCYGMNDGKYSAYTDEIGKAYEENTRKMVKTYQDAGVRVVLGSPGIVGIKLPNHGVYNVTLARLRDIARSVARESGCGFADVYASMLTARSRLRKREGMADFDVVGRDGVHADWHGQMAMAISFLRALGLGKEEIARIEFDLDEHKATVGDGHKIIAVDADSVTVESSRYPFLFYYKHPSKVLADMWPVAEELGFFDDLNRFILVVKTGTPGKYEVKWNRASRVFDSRELAKGINLAHEFPTHPFSVNMQKMWHRTYSLFTLQYYIQIGALGKQSEWVKKAILTEADRGVTVEDLVKDPMKAEQLAQRNVRGLLVPVQHKITVTRKQM